MSDITLNELAELIKKQSAIIERLKEQVDRLAEIAQTPCVQIAGASGTQPVDSQQQAVTPGAGSAAPATSMSVKDAFRKIIDAWFDGFIIDDNLYNTIIDRLWGVANKMLSKPKHKSYISADRLDIKDAVAIVDYKLCLYIVYKMAENSYGCGISIDSIKCVFNRNGVGVNQTQVQLDKDHKYYGDVKKDIDSVF